MRKDFATGLFFNLRKFMAGGYIQRINSLSNQRRLQMLNIDKAKVLVDLSKEKIDSIWNRRKSTWRTSFTLWAGLAAAAAALYKESIHITPATWICIVIVSIAIFLLYSWHWIGSYVSDEIGFSWAHYFQDEAEECLTGNKRMNKNERPSKDQNWAYHLFLKEHALRKLHAIIPEILVTVALMIIVLSFLHIKICQ